MFAVNRIRGGTPLRRQAVSKYFQPRQFRFFSTDINLEDVTVVKIFTTRQRCVWTNPWQLQAVELSTGSGAYIGKRGQPPPWLAKPQAAPKADAEGSKTSTEEIKQEALPHLDSDVILTAAHVVADAQYVQVQRSSGAARSLEKFTAQVVAVCHELDLALLAVKDPKCFEGHAVLEVAGATLPALRDKVQVVGFPVGGDELAVTEGVLSRMEVMEYSHSARSALALTVDAAINAGNSGGPVIATNGPDKVPQVIGVAFQKNVGHSVENQGHAVPAPLIHRFFASFARGDRRMPSLRCEIQPLEAATLRRYFKMEDDQTGVLVNRVAVAEGEEFGFREDDIIRRVDGYTVDNFGQIFIWGRRLPIRALLDTRFIGDTVTVDIWRDGKAVEVKQKLLWERPLVARAQYDLMAPYTVIGGLVMMPLSQEYLQGWHNDRERPVHLQDILNQGILCPERSEVVMLTQVLADDINEGYGAGWVGCPIVSAVNGEKIQNFQHFVQVVRKHAASAEYLVFDLYRSSGKYIAVLECAQLAAADARIQMRYHLDSLERIQPEHIRSAFAEFWEMCSDSDVPESSGSGDAPPPEDHPKKPEKILYGRDAAKGE